MATSRTSGAEPRPLTGTICFEEGDFFGLSEGLCGDAQFNDRRLMARRKLAALGKASVQAAAAAGTTLESRTSLHNPHMFNGMRVRRLWCYMTRPKAEKRRLKSVLGSDLAKDLDAAYRNAYLCVALEAQALEVSFRIHPDAWYDGQNLKNRLEREGSSAWRLLLNELDGWWLRLHDWKGEWRCGGLTPERLEEYVEAYTPGEHRLAVEKRWPAPAGARGPALAPEAPAEMQRELLRLLALYRFTVWSEESNFLFS